MAAKNELARITIEVPKAQHKRLKTRAAFLGKSMKSLVLEMLEMSETCLASDHYPNKETLKTISNIEQGKNLTEIKDLKALAKKFGL